LKECEKSKKLKISFQEYQLDNPGSSARFFIKNRKPLKEYIPIGESRMIEFSLVPAKLNEDLDISQVPCLLQFGIDVGTEQEYVVTPNVLYLSPGKYSYFISFTFS